MIFQLGIVIRLYEYLPNYILNVEVMATLVKDIYCYITID